MVTRSMFKVLPILAAPAVLAGCGKPSEPAAGAAKSVICTIYPVWLLARMAAEGSPGVVLSLLLPAGGGCPHDVALTAADARRLSKADLLFANGLGLEPFLAEGVRNANPRIRVVELAEAALAEEGPGPPVGGREGTAEAGARGDARVGPHDHPHAHEDGVNPHLFASPKRAARMLAAAGEALAGVDPAHADLYRRNAAAGARRLETLADGFEALARRIPEERRRIVAMHDTFDWLARDAGFEVVGTILAPEGSAPSAANRVALLRTIREKGAAAVFTEPQFPAEIAAAVAREATIPLAVLDPVASGPADAPIDYYETAMGANLAALERTLAAPRAP